MIFGTGELYLDCVMHDLRKMYSEIGIYLLYMYAHSYVAKCTKVDIISERANSLIMLNRNCKAIYLCLGFVNVASTYV